MGKERKDKRKKITLESIQVQDLQMNMEKKEDQAVYVWQTKLTSIYENFSISKNFSEIFQLTELGLAVEFKLTSSVVKSFRGFDTTFLYPSIKFHALGEPKINTKKSWFKCNFRTEVQQPCGGFSFIEYKPLFLGTEFRGLDQDTLANHRTKKLVNSLVVIIDLSIKDLQQKIPDEYDSIIQDFASLCTDDTFADFHFKVDGCDVPAHKALLAARSSYFDKIISSGEDSVEDISDVSVETFKKFLHYIYTDETGSMYENIKELLILAKRFEARELIDICSANLESKVDDTNATELFSLAHRFDLKNLKTKAFRIIQKLLNRMNQTLSDEMINKPEEVLQAAELASQLAAMVKAIKYGVKGESKKAKKENEVKKIDGGDKEKKKEGKTEQEKALNGESDVGCHDIQEECEKKVDGDEQVDKTFQEDEKDLDIVIESIQEVQTASEAGASGEPEAKQPDAENKESIPEEANDCEIDEKQSQVEENSKKKCEAKEDAGGKLNSSQDESTNKNE